MLAKVIGAMLLFIGIMMAGLLVFLYLNSPAYFDLYNRFYDLISLGLIFPIIVNLAFLIIGSVLVFGVREEDDPHLEADSGHGAVHNQPHH